jgi:hypothetical protein
MPKKSRSRKAKKQSTRSAGKRAAAKKKAVPFYELHVSHQKRVFSAVNAVLKDHGVAPLSGLHMDAHDDDCDNCPPGTACKMVCRRENGTIVCRQVCVPF